MFPETGIKWLDNKNEKVFWALAAQRDQEKGFFSSPQIAELDVNIPNRDAKKTAYLHDPNLITVQVDQAHPYQRTVDLNKLYDFTKPGHYRLQVTHDDVCFDHSGSVLSTGEIELTVLP